MRKMHKWQQHLQVTQATAAITRYKNETNTYKLHKWQQQLQVTQETAKFTSCRSDSKHYKSQK